MIINRVLKYRNWSKTDLFVSFFLLAVFLAELFALILLNQDHGPETASDVASIAGAVMHEINQMGDWTYRMVGPMIFPLTILTMFESFSIFRLYRIWRGNRIVRPPAKLYRILKIVEGVGPGFGFLGTCLSLIATMHHMDPGLSQADMLKELLENASSAFGSTVYGISLAISSYLALELFQNFLIIPEPKEVRTKNESRPTPETVALYRKEV